MAAIALFVGSSIGILHLQQQSLRANQVLALLGGLELDAYRMAELHFGAINDEFVSDAKRADFDRSWVFTDTSLQSLDKIAPTDISEPIHTAATGFLADVGTGQELLRAGDLPAARSHARDTIRAGALPTYSQVIEDVAAIARTRAEHAQRTNELGSIGLALVAMIAVGVVVSQAARMRLRANEAERQSAETKPFFALVRDASDLVTLVDRDGTVLFQNEARTRMLGDDGRTIAADLIGRNVADFVHPADRAHLTAALEAARRTGLDAEPASFECRWRHADGSWRICDTTVADLLDDPNVEALMLTTRDTSARHAFEEELRAVVETSPLAIVELAPDGAVRRWNSAAEELYGWTAEEAIGKELPHIPPGSRDEAQSLYAEVLNGHPSTGVEVIRLNKDGEEVQITMSMVARYDGARQSVGIVSFHLDTSERHRLEEELRHQAFHDSLTKLANRELFTDRLEHALHRAKRGGGRHLAVLFVDLDDFKTVNDSLGHQAGDVLLQTVADRIRASIRESDTAARLGGDEFGVLLEDLDDPSAADGVARKLLRSLSEPIALGDREMPAAGSIGIALGTGEQTADELLRNADAAMYQAKAAGKGSVRSFEPAMFEAAVRRLELKADLRRAVTEGHIVLHYQPIVELASGTPIGMEALVRWNRPGLDLVSPAELLPLAAELGLSAMLGREVLRQACRAARLLAAADDGRQLWCSVNASPEHLLTGDFVADARAAITDMGLEPHRLVVEINEAPLLADRTLAVQRLAELRELGVQLVFDDFGSGFASLSHLQEADVDIIKLDREFVAAAADSRMEANLAEMVVMTGRSRGILTVAEGVETEAQATKLQALGFDLGQGYHFGYPVSLAEALTEYFGLSGHFRPDGDGSQGAISAELDGGGAEPLDDIRVIGDTADPPILLGFDFG